MQNFSLKLFLFLSCLFISQAAWAQKINLQQLFLQQKIIQQNRTVTPLTEGNRQGLRLSEAPSEGLAWLQNISFTSGTIEVDIRGKDELQKSFVGIAFHAQNDSTFDAIYFRPFNFQAADTMRSTHAVQYISHPKYHWEYLRTNFPSKYENPIKPAPKPNDWFHVRLDISESEVVVYVNNSAQPSLKVRKISTNKTGQLGLWVGNRSGGDFANLVIRKTK